MYRKIMVPVDLAHTDSLGNALQVAADLSNHYDAPIVYVGITTSLPGPVAHNPEAFTRKLNAFAEEQASRHGITGEARTYISHDPARDLDTTLMKAIKENGVDLVIMASHTPGMAEHLFASNAGYLAQHAPISVFVIRS